MKRLPSLRIVVTASTFIVLAAIAICAGWRGGGDGSSLFAAKAAPRPAGNVLKTPASPDRPDKKRAQTSATPDVVQMLGPVSQDRNLKDLPYVPPTKREEVEQRFRRYPLKRVKDPVKSDPFPVVNELLMPSTMPTLSNSFAGITSAQSACGCLPPDTNGDVGSNHYIQAVNSRIKIIDKAGNQLLAPTTYNSFFNALGTGTPCGNLNDGDGVVFYDHIADRWVVSDFAFPGFPGTSFYQCIGVSKTSDPVAGGWWLYAVQTDSSNANFLGDYPKFGLWPDGYYMSVNMFSNNTTFNGVRVYAFDRNAMISGGAANTIAFTIAPADLGDQYSLLPATYRTGSSPPAGQPEYLMSINSSATAGTVENQVFVRRFHVDFTTPANSTLGVGATHAPDGTITVNGFVDAYTATTSNIIPNGTATTSQFLDTLGDKLMYPLVYQNLGGTESIYATHTINNNQGGTGPTAIRWYQFNVTGNSIPGTPSQQQTFDNEADGLWRAMPSINVDAQGNLAIGYTASSTTVNPSIRYAGRLANDPASTLAQGEAVLIAGGGHQTSSSGRWGDYSSMFVDPSDSCTFWHTNEYYSANGGSGWNTRIGSFKYPGCTSAATPTLSGTVTYGNAAVPPKYISNATVTGTGFPNVFTTTAAPGATAGQYLLTGFGAGSLTVSLSKTTGQNGITSNDAARIAQHVAAVVPLTTDDQKVAADVTGNGAISSQDAAKIAQYVAALPVSPPNLTGTWQFYVPPGPTFPVGSSPTTRTYSSIVSNISGEDYIGLLIGEVTGNWAPSAAKPVDSRKLAVGGGPEKGIAVELPDLEISVGREIVVPVNVQGVVNKGVISYEFDLRYDPSIIQPLADMADVKGTVSRGLSVVTNAAEPGLLRVVVYGSMPIDGNGLLLDLRFRAIGSPGSVSPLTWQSIMFNEGYPLASVTDGQVEIKGMAD